MGVKHRVVWKRQGTQCVGVNLRVVSKKQGTQILNLNSVLYYTN